jgi:hypothetical protein
MLQSSRRRRVVAVVAGLCLALLVPLVPGSPQLAAAQGAGYPDVPPDANYLPALTWAAENGITPNPDGSTRFGPDRPATRRNAAVFLWRMMDRPNEPAPHGWSDAPDHRSFRWLWANRIAGPRTDLYHPTDRLTRRHAAAFLYRMAGSPRAEVAHGYNDVRPEDRAVRWLREHRITRPGDGSSAQRFFPWRPITRSQLVLMLYRLAASPEAWATEAPLTARFSCELLDVRSCLLPFPSNHFTRQAPGSDTLRRVSFTRPSMPANRNGVRMFPREINRNDGFSPGAQLMAHVPQIRLGLTGVAPITNMARSVEEDSPVVIINTKTGERHPHWVELDAQASTRHDRLLIIRPARNFDEGTRYIVALRNLRNRNNDIIEPARAFRAYRDNTPTRIPAIEERRGEMNALLDDLAAEGVSRDNLYLAWDFTVASQRNLTERVLHIRDDALARLGGDAPAHNVTNISDVMGSGAEDGQVIARRVQGNFQVPGYLNTANGAPGSSFNWQGGKPRYRADYTAGFDCIVPDTASTQNPPRPSLYGHGLLGSMGEIGAGNIRQFAREHNVVFCATDWWGMSGIDLGNVVGILNDLSNFHTLADRAQQGFLNFIHLGRLMTHPNGLGSHPDLVGTGMSLWNDTEVFYDGNSQGGIMGGALVAVSPDIQRGVLGVPGMNYSTLLRRSSNWTNYAAIYNPAYPDELERPITLSLIQMLWDRAEANGYAHHMTDSPLPGSGPPKQVLLHVAFADWQVAQVTADVMARTADIHVHEPALTPGRHNDVEPFWDIPPVPEYPWDGSAMVYWDSGNPPPPNQNLPPQDDVGDPHSKPRAQPNARLQKSEFFDGQFIDVCDGQPCLAP